MTKRSREEREEEEESRKERGEDILFNIPNWHTLLCLFASIATLIFTRLIIWDAKMGIDLPVGIRHYAVATVKPSKVKSSERADQQLLWAFSLLIIVYQTGAEQLESLISL